MMWRKALLPVFLAMFVTGGALAQERERGPRGDREGMAERWGERREGARESRGPGGPGQAFGAGRLAENLQEQLGVDDEEWAVIQPKIQRVVNAQRATRAGAFGGGRGGEGGTSALAVASRNLRTALQNEETSSQEIAQLLESLREARADAEAELEVAQAELREVLTTRQEAVLVMAGILA